MNQGQGSAIILFTVTQFSIRYDKQYTGKRVELYTRIHQPSDKYHDEIDITRETAVPAQRKTGKVVLYCSYCLGQSHQFSISQCDYSIHPFAASVSLCPISLQ